MFSGLRGFKVCVVRGFAGVGVLGFRDEGS